MFCLALSVAGSEGSHSVVMVLAQSLDSATICCPRIELLSLCGRKNSFREFSIHVLFCFFLLETIAERIVSLPTSASDSRDNPDQPNFTCLPHILVVSVVLLQALPWAQGATF